MKKTIFELPNSIIMELLQGRVLSNIEKTKLVQKYKNICQLNQLLTFIQLSKSTYYYQLEKEDKHIETCALEHQIILEFETHKGNYGCRRITQALKNKGYQISVKTVRNIMNKYGLKGKVPTKKYDSYKGELSSLIPDLLNRDFDSQVPFQKLVTDITSVTVGKRKLYVCIVMDLFNNEILCYAIRESRPELLVYEVVDLLLRKKPKKMNTFILHSDRGYEYQTTKYQKYLSSRNIQQSMSAYTVGHCYNNSAAESFFATLNKEFLACNSFYEQKAFVSGLKEYLEYYNNERIVSRLRMSPLQYRKNFYRGQ